MSVNHIYIYIDTVIVHQHNYKKQINISLYIEILLQFVAVSLTLLLSILFGRTISFSPILLFSFQCALRPNFRGGIIRVYCVRFLCVDGKCNTHDEYNVLLLCLYYYCCCCCCSYITIAVAFVIAIIITDDELRFFLCRPFLPRFIIVCVVRLTCCVCDAQCHCR